MKRTAVVLLATSLPMFGCSPAGGDGPAESTRQPNEFERLVDIGGRSIWLGCQGAGSPTVVFESGTGLTHESWGEVDDAVADRIRVCVYDRAGYGTSDPRTDDAPLTPAQSPTIWPR